MPRRLLQLEVTELSAVHQRARDEFGSEAFVVAVEKVTVGGIAGFLTRQHYEVTVEVPAAVGAVQVARPSDAHRLDLPARLGIAALLADADDAELRMSGRADAGVEAAPVVSTASAMFDDLMRSLALDGAQVPPASPTLRSHPGDLVVVVGVRDDPMTVARSLAALTGAAVRVSGGIGDSRTSRIDNRRDALEARAAGVRDGCAVVVAIGVDPGRPDVTADIVRTLAADQVWVVVDAGRKVHDTSAWVSRIGAVVPIDAMAVLGRDQTATPESVDALGIPTAWIDGVLIATSTGAGSARR